MAWIATYPVYEGQSGEFGEKNSFSSSFDSLFSHYATLDEAVAAVAVTQGVYEGAKHPNYEAYCKSIRPVVAEANEAGAYLSRIRVTAQFEAGERKKFKNPLDQPADVQYGFEVVQVSSLKDADGNYRKTKAGEIITSGVLIEGYRTISVTRNEARFNRTQADEYMNVTNSGPWNNYPAETVLCLGIGAGTEQETVIDEKTINFFSVNYQFRARVFSVNGTSLKHYQQVYNEGYFFKDPDDGDKYKRIKDDDGNDVDLPKMLDNDGHLLADGADPIILEFKDYETKSFAALNITLPS